MLIIFINWKITETHALPQKHVGDISAGFTTNHFSCVPTSLKPLPQNMNDQIKTMHLQFNISIFPGHQVPISSYLGTFITS